MPTNKPKNIDFFLIPMCLRFAVYNSEDLEIKPNKRVYIMELFRKIFVSFAIRRTDAE